MGEDEGQTNPGNNYLNGVIKFFFFFFTSEGGMSSAIFFWPLLCGCPCFLCYM